MSATYYEIEKQQKDGLMVARGVNNKSYMIKQIQ